MDALERVRVCRPRVRLEHRLHERLAARHEQQHEVARRVADVRIVRDELGRRSADRLGCQTAPGIFGWSRAQSATVGTAQAQTDD
jgi:hypothetical protein